MLPAVVAGALLAFTYSFDDVIISLFVQEPGSTTLPVHILSSFKPGLRGDVAAIVVMTLGVSLAGSCTAAWASRMASGLSRMPEVWRKPESAPSGARMIRQAKVRSRKLIQ
jgi:ABC-type spermidine/putrescine transport system permease subunit II